MVTGMLTKIDADIDVKLTQTNLKKVLGEELYQ